MAFRSSAVSASRLTSLSNSLQAVQTYGELFDLKNGSKGTAMAPPLVLAEKLTTICTVLRPVVSGLLCLIPLSNPSSIPEIRVISRGTLLQCSGDPLPMDGLHTRLKCLLYECRIVECHEQMGIFSRCQTFH